MFTENATSSSSVEDLGMVIFLNKKLASFLTGLMTIRFGPGAPALLLLPPRNRPPRGLWLLWKNPGRGAKSGTSGDPVGLLANGGLAVVVGDGLGLGLGDGVGDGDGLGVGVVVELKKFNAPGITDGAPKIGTGVP